MENEFVTYDIALRMKALDFDEPCLTAYINKVLKGCGIISLDADGYFWNMSNENDLTDYIIAAPTWQSAFRFFREKYGIFGSIVPNKYGSLDSFMGWIYIPLNGSTKNIDIGGRKGFKTPEEVQQACLEKICEIVEKQK